MQSSFWHLAWSQLIHTSLLEWAGFITGLLCVYLAAKEHILNWPVAIISTVIAGVVYYQYKLYGDCGLQIYFLITSGYGWFYWSKRTQVHEKPIEILRPSQYLYTFLAIAILSFFLGSFLDHFTDTDVPYIDGICTAISFVAQLLMARKILQNWILWIIVDVLYIPLLLYKNLALFAILYAIYLALATMGYLNWKRTWKLTLR